MPPPVDDFEALCRRLYPRLVGALGLYTGDSAVGEELAQEALARAWRSWRKVSQADDPAAWLFVVGFNLAKSHLRRLRAEARAKLRLSPVANEPHLDYAEAHEMRRALAALPHRYRSVLVLRYYLGMSLHEIARHLDVPLPTVKTWCSRGLARLRNDRLYELKETIDGS